MEIKKICPACGGSVIIKNGVPTCEICGWTYRYEDICPICGGTEKHMRNGVPHCKHCGSPRSF